jgi:hypothetical protein
MHLDKLIVVQLAKKFLAFYGISRFIGNAIAQAVSCRLLASETRVRARSVHVGFVVDKVSLGQVSVRVLRFPLSVALHRCSILTHVSSGRWTMGPLEAQFRRDVVSPHRNSRNTEVHNCVLKSLSLVPTTSHMNPAHTHTPSF